MNRIISYSLFGSNPRYINGAIENVRDAQRLFPGWTCRFYVDLATPRLDELTALPCQIVPSTGEGYARVLWRHKAMNDPGIDYYISRDCDHRLNEKDAAAVDAFVASGKSLHVVTDPPELALPIRACTYGAKAGIVPDLYENLLSEVPPHGLKLGWESRFLVLNLYFWVAPANILNHGVEEPFPEYAGKDQVIGQPIWPRFRPKTMPFFSSHACRSHAHCNMCRLLEAGRTWRKDLRNGFMFEEPGDDWACPYGLAWLPEDKDVKRAGTLPTPA